MEITFATREDIPAIAALEAECFSLCMGADALTRLLDSAGGVLLCAREGDGLLGFGHFQYVMDEGYMGDLAVVPAHRRRGVGRALMEALCREARARGLAFLTLEVRESNLAAIHLYESCGFKAVGLRKNYYERPRENAVLMTAELGDEA